MLLLTIVLVHTLVSLTAARWWLRPLLLRFDRKFTLRPCKESDFYFFCWTWSIVLLIMGLYAVWHWFVCGVFHPVYRSVLPPRLKSLHKDEDTDCPPSGPLAES